MGRLVGWLFMLALIFGPIWLVASMIEPDPWVSKPLEATPEDALAARALVHRVRAITNNPDADPVIDVALSDIDAAMSFGARLIPGLRGDSQIVDGELRVRLSAPVPVFPGLGWVNAEAAVPEFDTGPRLSRLRVGGIDLPPRFSVRVGTVLADLVLGDDAGQVIMASVPWMELGPDGLRFGLEMSSDQRRGLTRGVSALLRGEEMPTGAEIQAIYVDLRDAVEAGRLPDQGSFLPYLEWVSAETYRRAPEGREDHVFTAALFALTKFCGARDFRLVVGRLAEGIVPEDEAGRWTRTCQKVTFAGRIDTKRHFITAASIKAASTMKVSFTIGEFKELFDSARRDSGFDFTDIVANASGIRFAERMMSADRAAWPALLRRFGAEADLLADFGGVPQIMSRAEFEAQYGDVESPAYMAMLAKIEGKIDRLPFHAPLPATGG